MHFYKISVFFILKLKSTNYYDLYLNIFKIYVLINFKGKKIVHYFFKKKNFYS
jgi:hypothetical protein